jgi:hypothetical protein
MLWKSLLPRWPLVSLNARNADETGPWTDM